MLRKFIYGLALAAALTLGAFSTADRASAQSAPLCSKFGPDAASLDSWGPCPNAPNIVVTTSNVGSMGGAGDWYLHLRDTAGASAACSTNEKYLGNWIEKMGGCGQFCFDFKVFKSGIPPGPITPSFTIWSGPTAHATFVADFTVTADTPWVHICAPVNLSDTPPSNGQGHWVVTGGTWNAIASAVTMIQLPIDFTSNPSEEAGYDNLCMDPKTCTPPPPVIDGCLKDSKVTVACNPDGTYTLTLNETTFSATDITLTSQTAGVTVTPPQQPWAATTTWTISGATAGQTVVLTANATKTGGGSKPDTDECCSAKITIVMPDCPKGEVMVEKKVKNETEASNAVINALTFPIKLVCPPSSINSTFTLTNGGPAYTENNVPYGSTCTVTETSLPPPPPNVCEKGSTAVWSTPVVTPASATINAPVTTFTVVNELTCQKTGILVVDKKVENHSPLPIPSSTIYQVSVSCGAPANLNVSFGLTDSASQTVSGIAYPSNCTITETPPSIANVCPPNLTPVWTQHYITTNNPTINVPVTNVTLINRLDCERKDAPVIDVGIEKTGGTTPACKVPAYFFSIKVTNVGDGWPGTGNIVVTDTVPTNMTFGPIVSPPWTCPTGIIPAGTTFTCTYNGPAPTAGQVLPVIGIPATPTVGPPFPPYVNTATVAIPSSSGYADTNAANNSATTPPVIKPSSCDCPPPMVMNAAGVCGCPPGMTLVGGACVPIVVDCHPPMVPNATGTGCMCPTGTVPTPAGCSPVPVTCQPPMVPGAIPGQCVCKAGYTLVGKECVKQIVCKPPLVPNAAGTDCVCRGNRVLRNGKCVEPVVCRPPAFPNRTNTGCLCPDNYTKKGNTCVENKRQRRGVEPGDVIRVLPGIIPGGGGHKGGGDSGGGGRQTPGGVK